MDLRDSQFLQKRLWKMLGMIWWVKLCRVMVSKKWRKRTKKTISLSQVMIEALEILFKLYEEQQGPEKEPRHRKPQAFEGVEEAFQADEVKQRSITSYFTSTRTSE